jgi:hypothetical protein
MQPTMLSSILLLPGFVFVALQFMVGVTAKPGGG